MMSYTEKMKQLQKLLSEMNNPTPNEFRKITTEFNKYRDKNNTNFEPVKISQEVMLYFLFDKYKEFEYLRMFRDSTENYEFRNAASGPMIGYFYEMLATIRRHDIFGWYSSGFNFTDEEMNLMKEYRHTKFHIPDDLDLFEERANNLINWEEVFPKIYDNSRRLKEYIWRFREVYPDLDKTIYDSFKDILRPMFPHEINAHTKTSVN